MSKPYGAAPAAHPGAGKDAERLFLARRGEGEKVLVGVQVLDQRGEHLVRHIGDQLHVVALEGGLHDLVPRPRSGRMGVHDGRPGETGHVLT